MIAGDQTLLAGSCLVITSRLGYRIAQSYSSNYEEPFYVNPKAHSETYNLTANSSQNYFYQWENFANYNKVFAQKHACGAMAGMSYTYSDNRGVNAGLAALNKVAERAGAPTYSSLTMENVKKEKWFEMAWEGTRFVDLVRWGDAATELAFRGKEETPYLTDEFYEYGTNGKKQSGKPHKAVIRMVDDGWAAKGAGFKAGKHELYPFPFDIIELNPYNAETSEGIIQNPGW